MRFSKHAPIALGTAALLLVIASLVTVVAYQQTAIQTAGTPEPTATTAPADASAPSVSDPSGDVQVVSAQALFSGKNKLTFVHECQGEVKVAAPVYGGKDFGPNPPSYCVGKNFLSVKDAGGAEVVKVDESTSSSAEDAPLLAGVTSVRHGGTVLIEYAVIPCSLSEESCGVGMPTNFVTYAFDLATKAVRPIKNYPDDGKAIWNDAGTKAIFPVVQRGGAGCDDGPIVGYDLAADATKAITAETACEFQGGHAADVSSGPLQEWGPTFWTSNDTFTAVLLGTDGKWKQIDGTF